MYPQCRFKILEMSGHGGRLFTCLVRMLPSGAILANGRKRAHGGYGTKIRNASRVRLLFDFGDYKQRPVGENADSKY